MPFSKLLYTTTLLLLSSPLTSTLPTSPYDLAHNNLTLERSLKTYTHYTALGTGHAAGSGHNYPAFGDDQDATASPPKCYRTSYSYPSQFVSEYGPSISLTNFNFPACLADNTLSSISSDQVNTGESSLSPLPRIWYDFGQPDLVSISVGDTDGEIWKRIKKGCVEPKGKHVGVGDERRLCTKALDSADRVVEGARGEMEELFKDILSYNLGPRQDRELYVIGLPVPYSLTEEYCPDDLSNIDTEYKRRVNELVVVWNEQAKIAAEGAGAVFAPVDERFRWHRICDEKSWFQTAEDVFLWLPTWEGYGAFKESFVDALLGIKFD